MTRISLPHSAESHRLTLHHHPESNLWTPTQGQTVEVDVYGWYSRRNGEIGWQTDLVQPATSDVEFSDVMTKHEIKTLIDALTYSLQWHVNHVRPQSRRGSGEVAQGELLIRRITQDIISKGTMT